MIIKEEMYIRSLKRKRHIDIYVPDDYQSAKKRYPVLIINDGQNAFFDEQSYIGKSWGFLESIKKLQIDVILVAIYCNFEPLKREDEYGPWVMNQEFSREYDTHRLVGGEGNAYVTFLTTQLKPYLDQNFPTKIDDYGIVGSSMGALISFYAFLKYPTIFKKCAILSTAFWIYEEEFVKLLKVSSISHNMLYMDVGGQEEDERYIPSNDHLCYYCSSSFQSFTGSMAVNSGVEHADAARAEQAILKELADLCGRDFWQGLRRYQLIQSPGYVPESGINR